MSDRLLDNDPLDSAVLRWLQEIADRGVMITDERLIVRRWNPWLAAQTGRSEADTLGRPLFELYPSLLERGFDQYYRDALSGVPRILSERLHRYLLPISRDFHGAGRIEMAQLARIEPLTDHGQVVGTITVIADVTERVLTERELRNQIAASEQARRVAEDASRLKDDFLATLSHEIRTPLNAVIGWSRMLRNERSVSSREHALDVIDRNARLQLRLVEDLLDMSRILSGKLQLKTAPVSFLDVVRAAVEVITPAAAARKIDVRLVVGSDESPVIGDADRLQQVVWNLLSNAVKFTTAGGSIRVEVDFRADDVRLTVRDTGQGIDPDFLPFVFDRFRQADASASRRQGGLGLGLALVKQIVELHGGTVGAESAGHGTGSAFSMTVPLAGAGQTSATVPQAPDVTLTGVSVLIVDDDDDARELLVALLGQYGARVRGAASGADALELLNDHAEEPDVLVSDIGMAGIDGYALIRRIRALESDTGRHLPAIAVTAYANPEDRVKALVAGYQTHIAKPVDSALLATAIAGLVADKVRPEGI